MISTRHIPRLGILMMLLIPVMLVLSPQQTQAQTVIQLDKLTATDDMRVHYFGASVAMSGTTVVVGVPYGGRNSSGVVYVYDCSSYPCTQVSELTASDAAMSDHFGSLVVVSGTTAVVSVPSDDNGTIISGSVYVFDLSTCGATCHEASKLTASDPTKDAEFGLSVAVDGTTVVVGAYQSEDGKFGSAYVFDLSTCGAICHETNKLTASDPTRYTWFGLSVAVSGTTALVAAYRRRHPRRWSFALPRMKRKLHSWCCTPASRCASWSLRQAI